MTTQLFKKQHLAKPIALLFMVIVFATSGFAQTTTERVYLSGTGSDNTVSWDFYCTGGRNSGEWTTIEVPSCWEQQGFGNYTYGVNFYGKKTHPGISTEHGLYKHTFHAPAEWQGKTIILIFEGVMTDARVAINGKKAGDVHQGGFYRFQYNITNYVKYGEDNLLEVEVKKESDDASVNLAERRADYWNFGGIFRPVFLEVKPTQYIDRTAIDAKADGSFLAEVYLGEASSENLAVEAELYSLDGKKVGKTASAKIVSAGDKAIVRANFENVKQWTPEMPNLYQVKIQLKKGEIVLHEVADKIGFRTIEIREGDGFYVNNVRVNLRGVNRHSFRPESGRTLNKEANYVDVCLIKEMNMNTVRLSHYPADPEFLDACDELGLYVLNEIGGWHGRYNTGVGSKIVKETVVRDVNHPSVVIWDNGNEGGWNVELDDDFHLYDPQKRPVIHPQQDLSGLETMHYRSYGETQEYLRGPLLFFPTEFLHGLYDGGHGAGLYDYWKMMYPHPNCIGGLLWVLSDEGIMRTDLGNKIDNDGNHGADGIVGPHHEKEGSLNTIKEIWSPVYIDFEKLPENFDGKIPVENRYDFTNLKECSFEYELVKFGSTDNYQSKEIVKSGAVKSPDIAPHKDGFVEIKSDFSGADALYLKATDKFGKEIFTWSWILQNQKPIQNTITDNKPFVEFTGWFLKLGVGDLELRFDRNTGMLNEVVKAEKKISFSNGPRFVAFRRGDRSLDGWVIEQETKGVTRVYNDVSGESKLIDLQTDSNDEMATIEVKFAGQLRSVKWTVNSNGEVQLDYTYRYDGVVELMGIQFDYPEEKVLSKQWLGEGPYRVWQNRLHGTQFNIWEQTYNDPIPGETFEYPEFKGFFGNWHWANFKTTEGRFTIATRSSQNYLGVYTPRDGRDALLFTFPQMGISVLDVIPAIRNKVNATDLIGPSSKPKYVQGEKSGILWFKFD